ADYLLPSAPEMPRIEIVHLEKPSPLNSVGAKGAGEGGTIQAAACIVSAIEDALEPFGVKLVEDPLSPEAAENLQSTANLARPPPSWGHIRNLQTPAERCACPTLTQVRTAARSSLATLVS